MKNIKEVREKVDAHPASILMIRQQWEQKLPMHRHQKAQLLLVIGGMAKLRTKEKDLYIPRNHYIWMPKMYSHNLMFNSKDLDIINIYFPEEEKFKHSFYDDLGIYPVSNLLSELLHFGQHWNGDFFPDSWEYEFLLTMKHLLPKENLRKFTIQLPTTNDERLTEIIKFVKNNLENPLTLEEVANKFGFSIRSLTRVFTSKLGISFVQYLKMLRIIRAMELLKDTNLSMSEIGYEIGYSNISAFSNTFQQLTNMRPTEFKSML